MSVSVRWLAGALLAGAFLFPAAPSHADEAMVKYRQSVMAAVGGHTKALAAVVKGEVPFSQDAKPHAQALDALAQMSERIFPEGSGTGKTEALPVIWEKPDDFKKAMQAFQVAAAAVAKAAETDPKALAGLLGDLVKSCKGCHDTFRKKE